MSLSNYYLKKGDKSVGPLAFDRLASLREQGKIQADALVAESPKGPWITLNELEASLAPVVAEEGQTNEFFDLGGLLPQANEKTSTYWSPDVPKKAPPAAEASPSSSRVSYASVLRTSVRRVCGLCVISAGILSGLLFFSGSYQMRQASTTMSQIRSEGGQSIDEAYFQQAGAQGIATSIVLNACGFGIIGISIGIGGLMISTPNPE